MPGLSDLKIKIGAKKEPHDLAWINDKERSVLKAMGGSGKPGPMGIPAYDVGAADDEAASTSGGPGAEPSEGEGGGWDEPGGYSKPGKDIEKGWDNPYDPGPLGTALGFIGDLFAKGFKSSAFGKVAMGVGEKLGGKGEELSPDDLRELDRISWEELSGPPKDPDRDGINDGDEIIDEIKKVEVEEDLTPMQKYFKDIQSATKNDIGMSQMTPEEKLITSLGIQNRVIEPFEQWLATQEEAVQNLPKWLQSTKYREYATNRTSPAQSYQPRTASTMASTEAIKDKTPATTELFNRLGMSSNMPQANLNTMEVVPMPIPNLNTRQAVSMPHTTPLPPGLSRNPETGEITVDPEGAKKRRGGIGWEYEDDWEDLQMASPWRSFDEQRYLADAYGEAYETTGLGRGDLGGGWSIKRTDPGLASGRPANSPSGYNYALQGPKPNLKGGGGIRDVLYRQTGGTTGGQVREFNPQLFPKGDPSKPPPFMPMVPNQPPFPMPDPIDRDIMLPEPPLPPIPPEPPKPTYDPVREAEAERRARELQAIKIGELDEAPQTRAEREALQAKGGFYRDEDGAVRDAMGNVQEDFGFDYVAPPEPGRPDPVNTPDTPKWEPPKVPEPIDTTPLPPGLVRNPETGEVTIDKELAKGYEGKGGWQFDDIIAEQKSDEEAWHGWDEQDYLRGAYMEGYGITKLPRGQLGGGWNIERSGGREGYPNAPEMYNYALKGPDTFKTMDKPMPLPDRRIYQPMIGQQLQTIGLQGTGGPMIGQPTGLQGLQQGMGQGFNSQLYGRPALQQPNYMQTPNVYPRPSMQSQNMQGLGQNMQGFGMQSPRPFGQKVY